MNFFEAQDNARKNTKRLMFLFVSAVITLVVLTNLLVAGVFIFFGSQTNTGGSSLATVPTDTWLWISLAVTGVVACASGYKYLTVKRGGRAIGELLGGRPLTYDIASVKQKRLLNIVEEMAIASGLPVPPVYVINELSINAFAAGFTPNDAIIGINQGTIDHLSRDELQGVVAHEFSHILNGDTHINLRLIAILHGILFLSILGYIVLRGGGLRASGRKSSGGIPIAALGLGLVVIGYAGTFFGNLIKAGVSRQREYLADAASVQFTRNPSGIADALKKIGGLAHGSTMTAPKANEVSHMFFGESRPKMFSSMLATHPPLEERIRAVDPGWDGKFLFSTAPIDTQSPPPPESSSGFSSTDSIAVRPIETVSQFTDKLSNNLSNELTGEFIDDLLAIETVVGRPTAAHLEAAHELIDGFKDPLVDAAHDPWAARALTYAGLLDADDDIREQQLAYLDINADHGVADETRKLFPLITSLSPTEKLSLFEMSMAPLKSLSDKQYRRFTGNLVHLIKLDHQIDLFEWVLHRVMVNSLKPHFDGPRPLRTRYNSFEGIETHIATLLAAVARHGHDNETHAAAAFDAAAATIDLVGDYVGDPDPNFSSLNTALRELRTLSPLAKPRLLKACVAAALHDDLLTDDEHALLQGVAATLDCPLPPLTDPL